MAALVRTELVPVFPLQKGVRILESSRNLAQKPGSNGGPKEPAELRKVESCSSKDHDRRSGVGKYLVESFAQTCRANVGLRSKVLGCLFLE